MSLLDVFIALLPITLESCSARKRVPPLDLMVDRIRAVIVEIGSGRSSYIYIYIRWFYKLQSEVLGSE